MEDNTLTRIVRTYLDHLPRTAPLVHALEDLPTSDPERLLETLIELHTRTVGALVLLELQQALDGGRFSDDELRQLAADGEVDVSFDDTPDDPRDLT